MPLIDPQLLELLVCPVPECRARLELRESERRLVCTACGRRYRIEESWPVLIPEEAEMPDSPGPAAG